MFDRSGDRKYLILLERGSLLHVIGREEDEMRRAFLLVLFHTGCRISEALHLCGKHVDCTGRVIVFETLKQREAGHYRAIPIPDQLVKLFRGILRKRSVNRKIWTMSRTTAYRLVKEKMWLAGISGSMACPKGLRHGFAVACVERHIPLTIVQKWLGHSRLETTSIYLNVSGREERAFAKRLWNSPCQKPRRA